MTGAFCDECGYERQPPGCACTDPLFYSRARPMSDAQLLKKRELEIFEKIAIALAPYDFDTHENWMRSARIQTRILLKELDLISKGL